MRHAAFTWAFGVAVCLAVFLVPGSAVAEVVGYWNLADNMTDQSANTNNGTAIGDPAYDISVPAAIGSGKSLNLDGNDAVDLGAATELDFATGNWTVSAWFRTEMSGGGDENKGNPFSNGGDSGGGHRYALGVGEQTSGLMTLTTDDDSAKRQAKSKTTVNDNAWHHVVGMRAGGHIGLFIDGVYEARTDLPAGYDLSGTVQHNSYIGCITHHGGGDYLYKFLTGYVDDVAVFDTALTDAAIGTLLNGTATPLTVDDTDRGSLGKVLVDSGTGSGIIAAFELYGTTDPAGAELVEEGLEPNDLCFTDRTHEWNEIPSFMLGAERIMFANDDRDDGEMECIVTLSQRATLYIALDTRVTGDGTNEDTPKQWMVDLGFTDTGEDIGVDENGDGPVDRYSSVYSATFDAGDVTLGPQGQGGTNMYGFFAIPEPATLALLGLGGCLTLLRRRRK